MSLVVLCIAVLGIVWLVRTSAKMWLIFKGRFSREYQSQYCRVDKMKWVESPLNFVISPGKFLFAFFRAFKEAGSSKPGQDTIISLILTFIGISIFTGVTGMVIGLLASVAVSLAIVIGWISFTKPTSGNDITKYHSK